MTESYFEHNNMKYYYRGNRELLSRNPIAFFCSRKIPIGIYLSFIPLIKKIMDLPIVLAGGFHSPVEKRIFKYLKEDSKINLIVFPAKKLDKCTINRNLRQHIELNKALIVSSFTNSATTNHSSSMRNIQLTEICDRFFFLSINPGGNIDKLIERLGLMKKNLYLFEHTLNRNNYHKVQKLINSDNVSEVLLNE